MSTEERLGSGLSFGTSYSLMDRQDNTAGPWNSDSDLPNVPSHTIALPGCILHLLGSIGRTLLSCPLSHTLFLQVPSLRRVALSLVPTELSRRVKAELPVVGMHCLEVVSVS